VRHFVIKFCDWCRIAQPMDKNNPDAIEAFDREHTHDEGWEQPDAVS